MILSIVVAVSENDVIGYRDQLPWHVPEDLSRFRRITLGHSVIMGRRTFESITARLGHPLSGRYTVALSRCALHVPPEYGVSAASLEEALAAADQFRDAHMQGEAFIAGGASVYEQALPLVDRIYLTRVHQIAEGDAHFPRRWLDDFSLGSKDEMARSSSGIPFTFSQFARR